jgi:hypothetical protein
MLTGRSRTEEVVRELRLRSLALTLSSEETLLSWQPKLPTLTVLGRQLRSDHLRALARSRPRL